MMNKKYIYAASAAIFATLLWESGTVYSTTAKAASITQTIKLKNNSIDASTYNQMMKSWRSILIGDAYYQKNNAQMDKLRAIQDKKVENLWHTMNKDASAEWLWMDQSKLTSSASLTSNYRNLEAMAIAYSDPASKYYQNKDLLRDTLYGFHWMNQNKYNTKVKSYGNWWDWEIGVPRAINDIVIALYPNLDQEEIRDNMAAIQRFVPDSAYNRGSVDPTKRIRVTGANQVDISKVKILQGVILKNPQIIQKAVHDLQTVFPLVDHGEGFYSDGSFIQHENVGYNGSYGNVLLDGVSQLLTVVQNTPFQINKDSLNNIKFWITKGFAPFIFKGNLMDMVRGRAISRQTAQSNLAADELIRAIVRVSAVMPKKDRIKFDSYVKYWLSFGDNYQKYVNHISNYRDLVLIDNIKNNKKIKAFKPKSDDLKFFNVMDKVIYKAAKDKYAFAINMSSSRIKRYEAMNNENIHGWYTGDGMVYLYDNDLDAYNDDYWATVDPTKIPGTTETEKTQKDSSGSNVTRNSLVGGSKLGDSGAFVMQFSNNDNDLRGNKSWFIIDGQLIALGSDFKNTSGTKAYTVIENRKINLNDQYEIKVNSHKVDMNQGNSQALNQVREITLSSRRNKEAIHYTFKKPENLILRLVECTGSWQDVNKGQSNQKISKTYLQILKDQTTASNYHYGISINEKMKGIQILKNDSSVQAVRSKKFMGINTLTNKQVKIKDFRLSMPLSLVLKQHKKSQLQIAFADPTQNSELSLRFAFKDHGYHIVKKSRGVSLHKDKNYWQVSVAPGIYRGRSFNIEMKK